MQRPLKNSERFGCLLHCESQTKATDRGGAQYKDKLKGNTGDDDVVCCFFSAQSHDTTLHEKEVSLIDELFGLFDKDGAAIEALAEERNTITRQEWDETWKKVAESHIDEVSDGPNFEELSGIFNNEQFQEIDIDNVFTAPLFLSCMHA